MSREMKKAFVVCNVSELSSGWTGLEPRFNRTKNYVVNPDKKKYLSWENRNMQKYLFLFPTEKENPYCWVETVLLLIGGVTEGVVKSCQQWLGFRRDCYLNEEEKMRNRLQKDAVVRL